MSTTIHPRLFVTGASGHLGRGVVEQLLKMGAPNVAAGSRRPEALADLVVKGAETVKVDFDDPDSLKRAVAGVERLLIISTDARTPLEQRRRQHEVAVAAAVKAGVGRIVYTSMLKPGPGSLIAYAPIHYETEQAIERSGIPFTILRVNSYAENAFWWLPPILASERWVTSAREGRVAYIGRKDVARTAAAALTATEALGSVDVGGPEALSASDIVKLVKEVFDVSIMLQQVSDEQREAGLIAAGVAAPVAKHLVSIDAATRNGDFDSVTDVVDRLTGIPPRRFRDFLIESRDGLLAAAKSQR
jgi:NAD(P)H dehydrogenase (quinone)